MSGKIPGILKDGEIALVVDGEEEVVFLKDQTKKKVIQDLARLGLAAARTLAQDQAETDRAKGHRPVWLGWRNRTGFMLTVDGQSVIVIGAPLPPEGE